MPAILSERTRNLHASPIREILAVIERPGMISFAGGLPAPETFPSIRPGKVPANYLQYGPTEGEPALRSRMAEELRKLGLKCTPEQVLILSGSQQGIDLAGKLFVDHGTPVAVESPTYLAALQVLRYFGARFVSFDPSAIASLERSQARLVYVIPTFQNPTGRCYSASARDALAAACDAARVTLFEDDPYRDLAYEDCDRTPVCARLERAPWIYQGSFSKSFAPGLRLGFLAASRDLVPYLTRLKQAADLHSNRISQWLVLQELNDPARGQRLQALAAIYFRKRGTFEHALRIHMSGLATWQTPPGGLFFWLTLKNTIDTRSLLSQAIERGVAFMPGEAFYPSEDEGIGTMRLNFSHASEEDARSGLGILSQLLQETRPAHAGPAMGDIQ
ncbi:MAG: PLP-dependent aminotransferase family protein [Burkholderiales bacterium]